MNSLRNPKGPVLKSFGLALRIYLVTFLGCAAPRPPAPPTTVVRAMETRTISADSEKVLKASINVLQDLSYTVDVINVEMGLLTASRTTQGEQARLTEDEDETAVDAMPAWQKACLAAGGVILVVGLLSLIFGGGGDGDGDDNDDVHVIDWGRDSNDPKGPVIHRYRVTINADEGAEGETKVRVSAQGEKEQDGNVLATGGIHEPEFFQRFFASLDKALFLEE